MIVSVLGRNGFIGGALAKRLQENGHTVFGYPRPDIDVLFYFASPSSDILFKHNLDYSFDETINGFISVVRYCRDNNIKLVYPSSATVYHRGNAYARTKAILEEISHIYGIGDLGLRIFAGYGIGEEHKGEYASIIYQFCRQMKKGIRPIIFGDGEQVRDFIYIDDIIDTILDNHHLTGIIDIGSGISTSFNDVVKIINEELKTDIEPVYIDKPRQYIDKTKCMNPAGIKVSLREGIKKICESL